MGEEVVITKYQSSGAIGGLNHSMTFSVSQWTGCRCSMERSMVPESSSSAGCSHSPRVFIIQISTRKKILDWNLVQGQTDFLGTAINIGNEMQTIFLLGMP